MKTKQTKLESALYLLKNEGSCANIVCTNCICRAPKLSRCKATIEQCQLSRVDAANFNFNKYCYEYALAWLEKNKAKYSAAIMNALI